jgi:hypothetical protein
MTVSVSLTLNTYRLNTYFSHAHAYSLFHGSFFFPRLSDVGSSNTVAALFAAILAAAMPFYEHKSDVDYQKGVPSSDHFTELSYQYCHEALEEFEDHTPPLCLLQALILTTYNPSVKGIKTRAWRTLGLCIRVVYELQLHCIDGHHEAEEAKITEWLDREERRRAFWAVWELDVLLSTERKTPTGISQPHVQTLLPVSDDIWFQQAYRPSSFLHPVAGDTCQSLLQTCNLSTTAWFMVALSMMREAEELTVPLDNLVAWSGVIHPPSSTKKVEVADRKGLIDIQTRVETLSRALDAFSNALPLPLRLPTDPLDLSTRESLGQFSAPRLRMGRHSILLVEQLTRAMNNHQLSLLLSLRNGPFLPLYIRSAAPDCAAAFYRPAESIHSLTQQTSPDQMEFFHPLLASILFFAALILLSGDKADRAHSNELQSKYQGLKTACEKLTLFWSLPPVLLDTLNKLESRYTVLGPSRSGPAESNDEIREDAFRRGFQDRSMFGDVNATRQVSGGAGLQPPSQGWESRSLSTSPTTGERGATNADPRMAPFPRPSDRQKDTSKEIAHHGRGYGKFEPKAAVILESTLFVPACV